MTTANKNVGRIPAFLQEALRFHQAGRLTEAERLYDKVLKVDRANPDALNLKGAIAVDQGRSAEAVALFNRAIAVIPAFPDVHFNKANALTALGKTDLALAAYAEAIRLRPTFANARLNAAALLEKAGRIDEAVAALRALTMSCPQEPRGYYALAVLLMKASPLDVTAASDAAAAFNQALALAPNDPSTHCAVANLYAHQGDYKKAAEHLHTALNLSPPWSDKQRAEVFSTLGEHLRKLQVLPEAVWAHRQALTLQPNDRDIRYNLATALYATRELIEAEELLLAVLSTDPKFVRGYINLGNVYRDTNRLDEAGAMFEAALALDPSLAVAYSNLGAICADRGWFHTGVALHDKAVALDDSPGARFKRGVTLLAMGRLSEGWRDYDYRFLSPLEHQAARPEPPPYWRGENLGGKSIAIWTEQGLGDEILHGSLISEVAARADRCTVLCSKRLVPVFARSFPRVSVADRETYSDYALRAFDYQVAVGSLGRHVLPSFAEFHLHTAYLKADPAITAKLRREYLSRADGRKVVGISWRSKNNIVGPDKSVSLLDLAPVLRTAGVMFVNLQYGECNVELAAARERLGIDVFQDPQVDSMADMDGFFAQVAAMDLVITTSNTTAHVAGAQNIPVWVLLPFAKGALWYWFLEREDSPWYPSARLFRAPKFDAARRWMDAIGLRVSGELKRHVDATGAKP